MGEQYSWFSDTMNRMRRSGDRWIQDLGGEEIQRGFLNSVIKDLEKGIVNFEKWGYVFLDPTYMSQTKAAARYKKQELFVKLHAVSFFIDRLQKGEEQDPYNVKAEYDLLTYDADILNIYVMACDTYEQTCNVNPYAAAQFFATIDEITTFGKRKMQVRNQLDIDSKPPGMMWSQYRTINATVVDRFIRGLAKPRTPVNETLDAIKKNPFILTRAWQVGIRRLNLASAMQNGLMLILNSDPTNQYIHAMYPTIKRMESGYQTLVEGLEALMRVPMNDYTWSSNVKVLVERMRDYNGAM